MSQTEQERLYKAYMVNSKNDKLPEVVRANALLYAKRLLAHHIG